MSWGSAEVMFVSTAQGWPARCSDRTALGRAANRRARREQHAVEIEHDARGASCARGRSGRGRSQPEQRRATRRGRRCARRVVGIAAVAIDEHGAQPAAPRRPRCRRRGCRPPSRRARRARRRARARRRRSSCRACGGRAHARRARSRRRSRVAPRTARARDRCWRRGRPCSPTRAGSSSSGSTSGKSSKLLGSPQASSAAMPICSASSLPAPMPRTISIAKRRC